MAISPPSPSMTSFNKRDVPNDDDEILDIAIIGSGPGGLSAALALCCRQQELKKKELKISIFDKAKAFLPIGAALGIGTEGYAALAEMGVAEQIKQGGAPPVWTMIQRHSGEMLYDGESMFVGQEPPSDYTWLGWYTLQTELRKALSDNVDICLNHKLIHLQHCPDHHCVRLDFEMQGKEDSNIIQKSIFARLVVGADGYESVVRQHIVKDGKPRYTGTMTWNGMLEKKSFDVDSLPHDRLKEQWDTYGFLTICGEGKNFIITDSGSGQYAWMGTAIHDKVDKHDKNNNNAQKTALEVFANWPPVVEYLIRKTNPSAIVETGIHDRDPVEFWSHNRMTLLGDAAHLMRPALGLGATMSFQDALCLAECIMKKDDDDKDWTIKDDEYIEKALKSYEKQRIAITGPLQLVARERGGESHNQDRAEYLAMKMKEIIRAKRENPNVDIAAIMKFRPTTTTKETTTSTTS